MSKEIDERVVSMEFDNRRFESNVQTSLGTINKLNQSLKFAGATQGFENISSAAKNINMNGLGDGVEAVRLKFSALEVMAVTALSNITNTAVNAGKRIMSALTVDPIKTGFSEYETQINAVQTILANTESKGTTLTDVNKALDELNKYADKTIYNFTQMTKNIGTFTAAGVDLDTSVSAIQGIANLAAVSGSTSQQASTAMYQLSQALAAGRVNLMDWNSVVNAGMGGQVFQDALKRTSRAMADNAKQLRNMSAEQRKAYAESHGYTEDQIKSMMSYSANVDQIIKKEGSFRNSLTNGAWLTTDVLTETLKQFTLSAEEGSAEWESFKKSLMDQGYTEAQANDILKMANTATNAATKVKTFTQLWDTLKESAQSGWTQTWEIIVGDFEEAKVLLTKVSDTIGAIIGKSADARNELLQGWKDNGGRTSMIDGFTNVWEGLINIVKPIKEAFRDIFPPTTVDQIVSITNGFKGLTESFKTMTETYAPQIKDAFRGVFSVVKVGVDVVVALAKGASTLIESFTGIEGGIFGAAAAIGRWLTSISGSISEMNIFGKAIDTVANFASTIVGKFKELGSIDTSGFVNIFTNLWDILKSIGSEVGKIIKPLVESVSKLFQNANLFDVLNTGMLAGSFVGIKKFVGGFSEIFESISGDGGFIESIKDIFDGVRESIQAYQNNLKAETLSKIATAIGILAASIFVVSSIDGDRLDHSLGAMTIMFTELIAALGVFNLMAPQMKGAIKAIPMMIGMSVAIAILAAAMKTLSTIDNAGIENGLLSVGILMVEIGTFLAASEYFGKINSTSKGIIILSAAMLILAKAVENFGAMSPEELTKGIVAIGALLLELGIFSTISHDSKGIISASVSLIAIGAAMKIFASSMKDFAEMSWDDISKGLAAMGGALLELMFALNIMPKNMASTGLGMVAIASSMVILADALSNFGSMGWEDIYKGLTAMGVSLVGLAFAMNAMNGTLGGSAALLVATAALALFVPVFKALGAMEWESIVKGLVALGGAFAIIGVAGWLLGPLAPAIATLAGSIALIGIATAGVGAGLALAGLGFGLLATSAAAGATALVGALAIIVLGVAELIPDLMDVLGRGILGLCTVIGECAPELAIAFLTLFVEVLDGLSTYGPQIVDLLLTFLIGVLDTLATRLPELITVAMNVIGAFFQGVIDALKGLDSTTLIEGIISVGFIAALMYALSGIVGLIPSAMAGVLGMGLVIAELALVLAAIGALAQIPGLNWLIEQGGDFLQTIGTAIGQFIGGIVGGIAEGATSTLPQVGTNLSDFMTNVTPFIDGIKLIDESALTGIKNLTDIVLALAGAGLLSALSSLFGGDESIIKLAEQLIPFAEAASSYSTKISGVTDSAVSMTHKVINMLNAMDDIDSGGAKKFKKALEHLGEASIEDFTNGFIGSAEAITNAVSDIMDDTIKVITDTKKKFTDSGKDLIDWIDTGIDNNDTIVVNTISDIAKNLVVVIKSYNQEFYNAGGHLVSGFAAGISANTYRASAQAAAMAAAAAAAARSELQVRSPSRVFYRIGDFSGMGFVNALMDYGKRAYNAGSSMARSASDGLRDALYRASYMFDADIDVNPTIRPVLDLSDISSGADDINNLFRLNPPVGVLAEVRSINSMMNRNQNGGDFDIVSAIKDLGRSLGNTSNNTYNINGVTYDDGTNVSDAVKALVRAARIERRV